MDKKTNKKGPIIIIIFASCILVIAIFLLNWNHLFSRENLGVSLTGFSMILLIISMILTIRQLNNT